MKRRNSTVTLEAGDLYGWFSRLACRLRNDALALVGRASLEARPGEREYEELAEAGASLSPKAATPEVAEAKKGSRQEKPEDPEVNLGALRKNVEGAKGVLDKAESEAKDLAEKARALVREAKDAYLTVLAPYRDACRKSKVRCEFEGGRSTNVTERVVFLVERVATGVKVAIKGKPETEEVIPLATLKESIGKTAYGYVDRWIGPRETIGNKGGSLSNRLRAAIKA